MTREEREEAARIIKEHCYFANLIPQAKEALNIAIKTLEQEPCENAISRQAAIDTCLNMYFNGYKEKDLLHDIKNLPSVNPEPCEDEYIKVPKKALKYRTAGMVAYNAEWLKNHFDTERAVICGAQEPCSDAISRQAVLDKKELVELEDGQSFYCISPEDVETLPPVNPQPKTGYISIDDVISVFDDFMCGEVDEDGTDTFLKMLKDRAESEG